MKPSPFVRAHIITPEIHQYKARWEQPNYPKTTSIKDSQEHSAFNRDVGVYLTNPDAIGWIFITVTGKVGLNGTKGRTWLPERLYRLVMA